MDWIKIRLNELEMRVFGRTTTALDALTRLLGRDSSFAQALAYIVEDVAGEEYESGRGVKSAAARSAQIMRGALGVRIVVEDALDHTVILYAPEDSEESELPLCDLSVKNGLIWRSVDS